MEVEVPAPEPFDDPLFRGAIACGSSRATGLSAPRVLGIASAVDVQ
jgi:hypothetical protein